MSAPVTFTMPKRPLKWLITGCSSGFGLELARIVQAHGHFVIATSRSPTRTPELVEEIEGKGGKWVKLDVDDLDSAQVLEDLEKDGHKIDVLVNNAGFGLYGPTEQVTEEEVRRLFDTLFFGAYRLTRAAVRHMRERRFGVIVNMSSASAIKPVLTMGVYGAAKAALDSVHRTLAREVADFNVRVLGVNPGVFNTPMTGALQYNSQPLGADYENSAVGMFLGAMKAGAILADGDTSKAMKVLYEVIVAEGVGEGHESETMLPLGREASKFIRDEINQLENTLEVFGDACNNVYVDPELLQGRLTSYTASS